MAITSLYPVLMTDDVATTAAFFRTHLASRRRSKPTGT